MSAPMNPTKGNLMAAKKSLDLAKVGFDLLDRKRNILIRETMAMIDSANEIQKQIDSTYAEAYRALQYANVTLGICDRAAQSVPIENGVNIGFRSVMGVEIPMVSFDPMPIRNYYGFQSTNAMLDEAFMKFDSVKKLTVKLAEIENSVYRLADAIKRPKNGPMRSKTLSFPVSPNRSNSSPRRWRKRNGRNSPA